MVKKLINRVAFFSLLAVIAVEVFGVPYRIDIFTDQKVEQHSDSAKQNQKQRRRTAKERVIKNEIVADSATKSAVQNDTLPKIYLRDSLGNPIDSAGNRIDSLSNSKDSLPGKKKSFLDAPIFGKNRDSLVYDVKNKQIYIYGEGDVKYNKMGLLAEYMHMNTKDKIIHAKGKDVKASEMGSSSSAKSAAGASGAKGSGVGNRTQKPVDLTDSNATVYIRPTFTEGDKTYDIDSIFYNMDTQKAYIQGVDTKEGEGYVFGGEIKKMKNNEVHMHNGRYTTCDAACPHFYLQMTKGIVVPDKKTVFGPSYLVFEDVPLYFLGLPFGFFPQISDRNSGVIIPEVGEEVIKGFFLRNGGYYFVINDNLDLRLTAGIYTLGSWEANAASNYFKRYKFGGSLQFNYALNVIGEPGSTDYVNSTSMRLMWQHRQDPKASPGSTFSASVNFSTSSYNKYNSQTLNDYLNTQTNSSIAYQKSWAGTPFSLTVNGTLSQEMRDTVYQFNLPNINFNVTRVNPFRRKVVVGKERWYEKIGFTYNLAFQNNTGRIKEKDLFKENMFKQMQYGVKHEIPIDATFNLFQYLNITPNARYTERWYFSQFNQSWNAEQNKIVTDTTRGFFRVPDYSINLSFGTILYGNYSFGRKGNVKLRHVMTPNISFSFSPGFNQFYRTIEVGNGKTQTYSPYQGQMYGVPSQYKSASLNFSLNNTLEMKSPSKTDTTGFKKTKIFEALNISSSYNFAADSLNLAPFDVSVRTTLFKGFSLQARAVFDPYQVDVNNRRINKFEIRNGNLARMTSFSTSFSYGFQSKQSTNNSNQTAVNNPKNNHNAEAMIGQQQGFFNNDIPQQTQVEMARMAATQYYDFNIPWSISLNYTFSYNKPLHQVTLTNAVSFNGSVNLTPKWGVSFGAGYDFVMNKITPGTVQVTRDLHCWQMSFSWIPVGYRQSWSFSIRAKSSMLSDLLKWDKNNSFLDNQYGR